MIFAIDPGLRHCGCAIGNEDGLYHAALVRNNALTGTGPVVWCEMAACIREWFQRVGPIAPYALHIEQPRIYPHSDQRKGDLNDLIELAGVVGAVAQAFSPVRIVRYYPADWKGQVPKAIMTERIRKKLRPDELRNFVSVGAKDHNTLDAVGIFLHSMRRLS